MILLMFVIGVIFAAILLYLGATQYSFAFLYLGWFAVLLIGMFTLSEGISINNGTQEFPTGSHIFIQTYDIHTPANDPIVNIIAYTFFLLPLAAIPLTTLIALRQ